MSPLRVSEKTLELNVCVEILNNIRSYSGCRGALWIGMKQQQEARLGLDELIHNLPAGMHLALQFKAPRSEPQDQIPYRFTINDRQNGNLLRLANNRPEAVYYIFSHYNTFTKMRSDSPYLLRDSWFLKVDDLRGLPNSTNRLGTHLVETAPPTAFVHSEPMAPKIASVSDTLQNILSREHAALEDVLISHITLKEWLGDVISEAKGKISRFNVFELEDLAKKL